MQLEGTEAWLGPLESRLRVRKQECNYAWSPSKADGPISVEGSLTGDRFDLWPVSPETNDFQESASCKQWDPDHGWSDGGRYSRSELVPLFQTVGLTVLPLVRQNWAIAARDGASEVWLDRAPKSGCGVIGPGGGFDCLRLQRSRMQVWQDRMPHAGEHRIAGIFETDLADVRPEYALGLLRVLLWLQRVADCVESGRATITVIVARTPGSEEFFLQALTPARIEALRSWLRQNGYPDASSIRIDGDQGTEDVVVVRFD